jgi:hypothetical protein
MEYEGAGSFWATLATSSDALAGAFTPRRIDDLLRSPHSSLVDLLLDEEVIQEFRSANDRLISRLTEPESVDFLLSVLSGDFGDTTPIECRSRLPFVATELISCEVDAMLDVFVRLIPGVKSPLDKLLELLSSGKTIDPTVVGYICRVLTVLYTKRRGLVTQALVSRDFASSAVRLMAHRAACDLIVRLMTDEEGPVEFDWCQILDHPGESLEYMVHLLIEHNHSHTTDNFPPVQALVDRFPSAGDEAMNGVISSLLTFCFCPPKNPFSEVSTPEISAGWEAFPRSTAPALVDSDEDEVMIEVESPRSTAPPPRFPDTELTRYGRRLRDGLRIEWNEGNLELISRLIRFGESSEPFKQFREFIQNVLIPQFEKNPKSSHIHNLVRDCFINLTHPQNIAEARELFVPAALAALPGNEYAGGHVCRILWSLAQGIEVDGEWLTASSRWREVDTRLADRPTGLNTSHIHPIVDDLDTRQETDGGL